MHNRSEENFHEVFIIWDEMQISPHLHHDCAGKFTAFLSRRAQSSSVCVCVCVSEETPLWRRGAQSRPGCESTGLMNIHDARAVLLRDWLKRGRIDSRA